MIQSIQYKPVVKAQQAPSFGVRSGQVDKNLVNDFVNAVQRNISEKGNGTVANFSEALRILKVRLTDTPKQLVVRVDSHVPIDPTKTVDTGVYSQFVLAKPPQKGFLAKLFLGEDYRPLSGSSSADTGFAAPHRIPRAEDVKGFKKQGHELVCLVHNTIHRVLEAANNKPR
jgi:hypothetical protein